MISTNSPTVVFWAVVRSLLGIAQMAGAVASLALLIRVGAAKEMMIALSVTMGITVLSILLFKILKMQDRT
jgi:hypothetical protein